MLVSSSASRLAFPLWSCLRRTCIPTIPGLARGQSTASIVPPTAPTTPPSTSTSSTTGTINSTAPDFSDKSKMLGSYHWDFERGLSIALVPLVTLPFLVGPGNALIDLSLGVIIPLHIHLGLDCVIEDYLPARRAGAVVNGVATWGLRVATLLALYGFWKLNTHDVGVTESVKRLWTGKVGVQSEEKKI